MPSVWRHWWAGDTLYRRIEHHLSRRRRVKSSREKGQARRQRLRKQGLRPVQIWVPDVRSKAFAREAHRQSLLVVRSPYEAEDQAFVDAISDWNDEWSAARSGPPQADRTALANRVLWSSCKRTASDTRCRSRSLR